MKGLTLILCILLTGCATTHRERTYQKRVGTGAAIGGVIGGVIGHNKGGRTAEGAAIGIAAGSILGHIFDSIAGPEPREYDHPHHEHTHPHYPERRQGMKEHYPHMRNRQYRRHRHHCDDTVIIQRRVIIEEEVPIHKESRRYYIDPETGQKVYVK